MELKLTNSVMDILNIYDANKLLTTIPNDYSLNDHASQQKLKLYEKTIKQTTLINVDLSTSSVDRLENIRSTGNDYQPPLSLLFNYLIEMVCDCNKIQTKKITRALDCYYYAINNDKSLFSRILDGYANSVFYNDTTGLSEDAIAYFLTVSEKRSSLN